MYFVIISFRGETKKGTKTLKQLERTALIGRGKLKYDLRMKCDRDAIARNVLEGYGTSTFRSI